MPFFCRPGFPSPISMLGFSIKTLWPLTFYIKKIFLIKFRPSVPLHHYFQFTLAHCFPSLPIVIGSKWRKVQIFNVGAGQLFRQAGCFAFTFDLLHFHSALSNRPSCGRPSTHMSTYNRNGKCASLSTRPFEGGTSSTFNCISTRRSFSKEVSLSLS